jgi:tetratricopeptide (TPR) repeat protein
MKMARNILSFVLLLILLPLLVRSQTSSLRNDPVFQAARKAQQEGRIADAEKILNDRIHDIEQTQPDSPELVPYLKLLASIYGVNLRGPDRQATFERVLKINERVLEIDRAAYGPSDSRLAHDLINVASFLGPDKKDQAEQFLKEALELTRQNPKLLPMAVAEAYAHLARFYEVEQRWSDAEPLAEQGMKVCAYVTVPPDSGPCGPLQKTLSNVYRHEGRTVEGEQVAASAMGDQELPPELDALEKSAQKSEKDGLYPDAEFSYRQAAAYIEAHPEWNGGKMPTDLRGLVSTEYNSLGRVLEKEGRNDLAEEAYKKAIASLERRSSDNKVTLQSFSFLGLRDLYRKEKRLDELEPIIARALQLQEKTVGESSTKVAQTLVTFGNLYKDEGKLVEAEPLFERAMKIYEANLGLYDRQEVYALQPYVDLLQKLNEGAKAVEIQAWINMIEKH